MEKDPDARRLTCPRARLGGGRVVQTQALGPKRPSSEPPVLCDPRVVVCVSCMTCD